MTSEGRYEAGNFINRELSWLDFNYRVLQEACPESGNPLFERLKFASIVSSNLDEFFMVRVGSLTDQILAGFDEPDLSGLTPGEQVKKIKVKVHDMVGMQYECYNSSIVGSLKKEGIKFLKPEQLSKEQKEFVGKYYKNTVYPVLTPLVVDKSRPFPLILNKSLNIVLALENTDKNNKAGKNSRTDKTDEDIFGTIQVPSVLDRIVEIHSDGVDRTFVFLEDIIKMNIDKIYSGRRVLCMSCYRITRNADQGLDEEGAEDLLNAIEQFLKERKWGRVVRLEIESNADTKLINFLIKELEISSDDIYNINGPLDLTFLMKFYSFRDYNHLRYPVFMPQPSIDFKENENLFDTIRRNDIMLHHPYDSFEPVVELVEKASADPDVLAIKQTLYRVGGKSPIVEALARAAENGKQVMVLVELKARFDEEKNILWAKRLEKAGCHVIYGLLGLKTHCKILLIVRKEKDGIRRYVHTSTGNYNVVTTKQYVDLGLFTSNPYFGADTSSIFNMLSGYSKPSHLYKMTIAPVALREKFKKLIQNEARIAAQGMKAMIVAKMNSLVDREIIECLYDASRAGVEIDLIIRGICCLRPGIPGVSDNIRVRSIVGRYLEHSRIYYFYNNADELYYISSADLMDRNMDRRIELLFPVENEGIKERLKNIIYVYLKDNVKARILESNGNYRFTGSEAGLSCQQQFAKEAEERSINK